MKKLYITMLAVLFTGAYCMADDVVTFEEFEVNANGYQNDFGDDACFEAGGFTFNCNYFPEWYYWSGFAISSRTETSFADYTTDQFNSCVGSGVNGSQKYVVAYPQGETIDVNAPEGRQISGFYVTNNAWTVDAILNGDGMTPGGFTTGDYLTLWIIGNHPDETADTLYYYLADYRSENVEEHYYVNDWRWVDLTALGTVESITFRMDSSRKNDWGVTTPTYFCMDDFNGVAPIPSDDVVTFEEFEVNANGYQNDFGDDACFEAGGFTFNCNYFPEWYYWSGFAISSRTETSFADYTTDQFNSCVGSGVNGSQKYVVAYPQGETIDVNAPEGRQISGFYVTNNAWAVDAILNGDGMTPGGFTTGDYLTLWIIGNHPDGTADTLYYYLADYRSENVEDHYYVNDWRWVDLTALGTVESITFRMDSSRKNDWGVTTPTYFCMDDFNGVAPATTGVATFEEIALAPNSYYNGAGVEGTEVTNSWGMTCIQSTFRSGGYDFTTIYDPTYGSWSGIGVSNDTGNTYATLSDQYRNCVGGGFDGSSNFAVVYPSTFHEAVAMTNGPETISGMYITNSAWNVDAYLNGDGMTPGGFTTGDWCKLTITGEHADGTTTNQEIYLADYRSENTANHYYINQWQWVDLTCLGEITKIWFEVTSSRFNDWGMTTPGYFCMDNFNGEPDATVGISCPRTPQMATVSDNVTYTLQGIKVEGTLKPGVYVRNGKKFVVK